MFFDAGISCGSVHAQVRFWALQERDPRCRKFAARTNLTCAQVLAGSRSRRLTIPPRGGGGNRHICRGKKALALVAAAHDGRVGSTVSTLRSGADVERAIKGHVIVGCARRNSAMGGGLSHRIAALLATRGVRERPSLRSWDADMRSLRTGDGRPLPTHLVAELNRLRRRLSLTLEMIRELDAVREQALEAQHDPASRTVKALCTIRGIGVNFASVLTREVFYRTFDNRRQIASYLGLAPTPGRSSPHRIPSPIDQRRIVGGRDRLRHWEHLSRVSGGSRQPGSKPRA
jgi:hypothetical protein